MTTFKGGLFRKARMLIGAVTLLAALPLGAAEALSPRAVAERFDSLMEAGATGDQAAMERARALTIGPARRLFPLLAETQAKVMPFLDTAYSRDTILEERRAGRWTALKARVVVVFRMPFLGLDSLPSVQAVHLYQDDGGAWKIADFEELAGAAAPLVVRTGVPAGIKAPHGGDSGAADGILPLSRLAPSNADMRRVTRLRLRVSLRGGDSLSPPAGPGRRLLDRGASWVEIETTVPALPDSLLLASWDDTLAVYRASTPELDLTDKMLRTRAAKLKQGSPHDLETARRIGRFVSGSFEYRLGATLFAGSREALRGMRGDCSEAAVLTAALLRAAGIPSRVVMGFATLESGVWIGHAWTEAWIGGSWIGLDAALREFPAGASRVALTALSGEREMKPEATNLMIRMLANLDIQITGAWTGPEGGEPLPLVEHPDAEAAARAFWDRMLEGLGRGAD
jgi:hypothetical protein